jgi:hypothetical protein
MGEGDVRGRIRYQSLRSADALKTAITVLPGLMSSSVSDCGTISAIKMLPWQSSSMVDSQSESFVSRTVHESMLRALAASGCF